MAVKTYSAVKVTTSNAGIWLLIQVIVESQDNVNNTSAVRVNIMAQKSASSTTATRATGSFSVVNLLGISESETFTTTIPAAGAKVTIASFFTNIKHNSNGEKDYSFTLKSFKLNTSPAITASNTKITGTLPTIKILKASTFTSSSTSSTNLNTGLIAMGLVQSLTPAHNVYFQLGNESAWFSNIGSITSKASNGYLKLTKNSSNTSTLGDYTLQFKPLLTDMSDSAGKTGINLFSQFVSSCTMNLFVKVGTYRNSTDAKNKTNAVGYSSRTVKVTIPDKSFRPYIYGADVEAKLTYYPVDDWSIYTNTSNDKLEFVKPTALTLTYTKAVDATSVTDEHNIDTSKIASAIVLNKTKISVQGAGKVYNDKDKSPVTFIWLMNGTNTIRTCEYDSTNTTNRFFPSYTFTPKVAGSIGLYIQNKRSQVNYKSMIDATTTKMYSYTQMSAYIDDISAVYTNELDANNHNFVSHIIIGVYATFQLIGKLNNPVGYIYYRKNGTTTWTRLCPGKQSDHGPENVFYSYQSTATTTNTKYTWRRIEFTVENTRNATTNLGDIISDLGSYEFKLIYHDAFTSGSYTKSINIIDEASLDTLSRNTSKEPTFIHMKDRGLGLGGIATPGVDNMVTVRWDSKFRGSVYLSSTDDSTKPGIPTGTGNSLVLDTDGRVCSTASAKKYKYDITNDLDFDKYHNIFENINPIEFKYNGSEEQQLGFLADEIDELDPDLTLHNRNGEVENYKDRDILALLYLEVKRHNRLLSELINTEQVDTTETDTNDEDIIDITPNED